MRASSQAERRRSQGEAAAVPRPTVAAAAPTPPPAPAAPALPLHPPLPQGLPAAPLDPPPLRRRGGAALPPARPAGGAEAAVPTGIVARRAGTGGGGAARSDRAATRKSAVFPGSAGVTGPDPGPETEIEAGRGPETAAVAAKTGGIRRGNGAASAGTAVTVEAANTNRRPQAKTETGGETGVEVMTKRPRKGRIKTTIKKRKQTERRKSLDLRRRKALLQKRMANQRKGKRVTRTQSPKVTNTLDKTAKPARRAPAKLAGDTQSQTLVDPPPLKLARKRNLRNPNVVVQGRWKNLTSLVRRQAANTSLSRDQGSIRFFPFSLTLCSLYVLLKV